LADIFDIWFDEPPQQPVSDLRRVVQDRRERQRVEFCEAVHTSLSPLEAHGFVFSYPRDRLIEHPLTSICIGFEVLNFETRIEQMVVIIVSLASFPLEYDFLHLVPLLDGATFMPTVWRISSDSVRNMAAGIPQNNPWTLLPVEPPSDLSLVLPNIPSITLPELELLMRFNRLYMEVNAIRNTAYFVMSRLDAEQLNDVHLGDVYQGRLQDQANEVISMYKPLLDQMYEFEQPEGSVQLVEWINFCNACEEKFQSLLVIINVNPSEFESINVLQDRALETQLGRYLNAKFRYHMVEDVPPSQDDDALHQPHTEL
jgi:hypothetical protein